jgi:hypothetical protein
MPPNAEDPREELRAMLSRESVGPEAKEDG